MSKHRIIPLAALCLFALVPLGLGGCMFGDDSAAPLVNQDPDGDFAYLGGNGAECTACHAEIVESVQATLHSEATRRLDPSSRQEAYCLQCHTTGWDTQVLEGSTSFAPIGPNHSGYDDFFLADGELAATRRLELEGVQCESCHGAMGPDVTAHDAALSYSTHSVGGVSRSQCADCHDAGAGSEFGQWAESGHALAAGGDPDAFNAQSWASTDACRSCHTAEGFIWAVDSGYEGRTMPSDQSSIGCVACHDPHATAGRGGYQLRTIEPASVAYHPGRVDGDPQIPRYEGYGSGQICGQCHQARPDHGAVMLQLAFGDASFGPHHSPQMDMFIGEGCYEIYGFNYDGTSGHNGGDDPGVAVADGCVTCHMQRSDVSHGLTARSHSTHDLRAAVGSCNTFGCHSGATGFDVNGAQSEVAGLMDDLAERFGYADAATMLGAGGWDSEDAEVELWQREAAYALYFVAEDGSAGVHNPSYARSLLENAITYWDLKTAGPLREHELSPAALGLNR